MKGKANIYRKPMNSFDVHQLQTQNEIDENDLIAEDEIANFYMNNLISNQFLPACTSRQRNFIVYVDSKNLNFEWDTGAAEQQFRNLFPKSRYSWYS